MPSAPTMEPDVDVDVTQDSDSQTEEDLPYNVFLWNDDVNDMHVVAHIIQKVLGYDEEKALSLMLVAHEEGKAVVWTGKRDKARTHARKFHSFGLQATVGKDA